MILLVEDTDAKARAILRLLSRVDMILERECSARDGVLAILKSEPHAVITDWELPGYQFEAPRPLGHLIVAVAQMEDIPVCVCSGAEQPPYFAEHFPAVPWFNDPVQAVEWIERNRLR